MAIFNVTDTSFTHVCQCGKRTDNIPHARLRLTVSPFGDKALSYVSCEQHKTEEPHTCSAPDCVQHAEHFNVDLPASEETSETRDEASREQARNVRLLCKHLGLPLVEER